LANHDQASLNLNETALLGLLADKPRYGYELDKIIKDKYIREWTDIAFSSIYAILKGLEEKGCVESNAEIAGNRVRRHYAITRKGRKTLRASTIFLLSEPNKTSDSLLAGLANKELLAEEDVKEALSLRVAALKRQLVLADDLGHDRKGKDRAYFAALAARTKGRVAEELRFVEELMGEAPVREIVIAAEPEPPVPIKPEKNAPAPAPIKKQKPLIEQPVSAPDEDKKTLF
jgi:DNA-binding PadR family transcriptional regulator